MATITIIAPGTKAVMVTAPDNMLDFGLSSMALTTLDPAMKIALVAVRLKLYCHGVADLGYGIRASIEGQLGHVAKAPAA